MSKGKLLFCLYCLKDKFPKFHYIAHV